MPLLTIIVPVHNASRWLQESVSSILDQRFREFELLLCDDGSSDDSLALCEAFAREDPRIRTLAIPHGGPSRARNTALAAATGDYVGFVDADDWIEPVMYQELLDNSLSHSAEISACGFTKIPEGESLRFESPPGKVHRFSTEAALESMFKYGSMRYSVCNKLFRRTLFDGIRFPEDRIMEDKATTYRLIHRCQAVVWTDAPRYHYRMHPGSIMHAPFDRHTLDILEVNRQLMAFLEANHPGLVPLAGASGALECHRLLRSMAAAGIRDQGARQECLEAIRRYLLPALRYPVGTLPSRLALLRYLPDVFR